MKYLCLVMVDEQKLQALSEAESRDLDERSLGYDDVLRETGHFLAAQALEPTRAAKTLRMQNGKLLVTDGPFAEAREQIGGFILIDVKNMDEAVELTRKIPVLQFGSVEVRPVRELIT